MSANSGVYRLRFADNSCYIGASKRVRQRIQTHISWLRRGTGQTTALQTAWDKHGAVYYDVLVWCAPENLALYEKLAKIALQPTLCCIGYGGNTGRTLSELTRQRMSHAARNKVQTQGARQYETWADPEIRARRIAGMKRKWEERKCLLTTIK